MSTKEYIESIFFYFATKLLQDHTTTTTQTKYNY